MTFLRSLPFQFIPDHCPRWTGFVKRAAMVVVKVVGIVGRLGTYRLVHANRLY